MMIRHTHFFRSPLLLGLLGFAVAHPAHARLDVHAGQGSMNVTAQSAVFTPLCRPCHEDEEPFAVAGERKEDNRYTSFEPWQEGNQAVDLKASYLGMHSDVSLYRTLDVREDAIDLSIGGSIDLGHPGGVPQDDPRHLAYGSVQTDTGFRISVDRPTQIQLAVDIAFDDGLLRPYEWGQGPALGKVTFSSAGGMTHTFTDIDLANGPVKLTLDLFPEDYYFLSAVTVVSSGAVFDERQLDAKWLTHVSITAVPEPSGYALVVVGLAVVAGRAGRRRTRPGSR
jgi:hypothetical protein